MNTSNNHFVCVRCATFNHAPYIKDAMDGFCMQQTAFPFVCVITDDASTDGEQEIIKSYMTRFFKLDDKDVARNVETDDYVLTFAQHKTNENCFFAVYYLKYNHYSINKDMRQHFLEFFANSKYIALCEGDDYWIDSSKLQKQVDFMESNVSYSMIHTNFNYHYPTYAINDDTLFNRMKSYEDYENKDLMYAILDSNRYRIQTCSVLYRKCCYDKIVPALESEKGLFMMGDTPLWIRLLSVGKIKYLQDITSVYRVVQESASHHSSIAGKLKFAISCCEMRYYYANLFNVRKNTFYYRYLKELVKILAINSNYRTNSCIFANKIEKMIALVVSSSLVVKLAKFIFVDSYIKKLK